MSIIDSLEAIGPLVDARTGEERRLREWRFRYLGLYFTATWCASCVGVGERLARAVERVNSGGEWLRLITLRLDDDASQFGYNYLRYRAISFDKTSGIASLVGPRSIPSVFVYDLMGRLVTRDGISDILNYQERTVQIWDRKMD